MKKIVLITACALMLSPTFAVAQSSQGKGGAAITGETADPEKGIGAPGSSTVVVPGETVVVAPPTTNDTTVVPQTVAPVPNAAISKPPGDAAAPAGR